MAKHKRKGAGVKPDRKPPPAGEPTATTASGNLKNRTATGQASTRGLGSRTILLVACLGYFAQRQFLSVHRLLLPHGPAVKLEERPSFKPIDPSNDKLKGKHGKLSKIFERMEEDGDEDTETLLKGPEAVIFNPKTRVMYVLTEEALLVNLTDFRTVPPQVDESLPDDDKQPTIITAKATSVVDIGMGRPMGGGFTSDGKTIYIADALLGLIRIVNPHAYPRSKVELVANQVPDSNGTMTRILFAKDLTIGPKSGKVYFTDASDIPPDRIATQSWDTMHAARMDMARAKRSGRLIEYNPKKNQLAVLASGLWFASGVSVDRDESYILITEAYAPRMLKYHLKGRRKGELETMVDSHAMVGYPGAADVARGRKGKCYAVFPSAIAPISKFVQKVPHPFDVVIRNLYMMIWPKFLTPRIKPYGGVIEVDPKTKEVQYFQDPEATDIGHLASVTVWDKKLYLGSQKNNFIGVYDLK